MTEYVIHLVGGADDESGVLTKSQSGEDFTLSFLVRGRAIEATSSDFFAALCEIRQVLAADGLIPFCYGASQNVYPSGMSRQMSGGVVAYQLTLGKPNDASTKRVNIFQAGPDVIPASVDSQQAFFRAWVASLQA